MDTVTVYINYVDGDYSMHLAHPKASKCIDIPIELWIVYQAFTKQADTWHQIIGRLDNATFKENE